MFKFWSNFKKRSEKKRYIDGYDYAAGKLLRDEVIYKDYFYFDVDAFDYGMFDAIIKFRRIKTDEMNKRKRCTKENPSDGRPYEWYHPDAKCIRSYDGWAEGSSYDEYKCPHCGIIFKEYVSK